MELANPPASPGDVSQPAIAIVRDPECRSGVPVLAGTRMAVHDIVSHVQRNGGDLQRVVDDFPYLTVSQVEAVLAWYRNHQEEIDDILRHRREDYERIRARTGTVG